MTLLEATEIARLTARSLHDPLTGLPATALLLDRVTHSLQRWGRRGGTPALAMVDLERIRSINDKYGRDAGDAVLVEVAQRLRRAVRPEDTVARTGDDEFAMLIEQVDDLRALPALTTRFESTLASAYRVAEVVVRIGVCVVVIGATATDTPESLFAAVDKRMAEVKRDHASRY